MTMTFQPVGNKYWSIRLDESPNNSMIGPGHVSLRGVSYDLDAYNVSGLADGNVYVWVHDEKAELVVNPTDAQIDNLPGEFVYIGRHQGSSANWVLHRTIPDGPIAETSEDQLRFSPKIPRLLHDIIDEYKQEVSNEYSISIP